jgi:ABC-2 type transport system ATP-binding protein
METDLENVLTLEHVSKAFGKKQVVSDLSLSVQSGEVFGFLGPNGAGKTTTIKMIMGFLSPDAGKITIGGYDLKKRYENAMAFAGGIVENPEMYRDLSGRVNLEMYARLHDGVTKERINEVVELVGLQNRINEKVKKYSLGMKQRLGLAQAMLHRPKLLVLDEPTNGLDPAGIKELRDLLKKISHEEGSAVFVSSHMLPEMELMCDRVGIILTGKMKGVKPIGNLLEEASGASKYRFKVSPRDRAISLLGEDMRKSVTVTGPDSFELSVNENAIPGIVVLLAAKGIAIYGVAKQASSLEEAFISITGGGDTIA